MLTFLKKHYEKVVFIAFLLVFIVALVWQLQIIMAAFINPNQLAITTKGANYVEVNMDQYNVIEQLADSDKWSKSGPRNKDNRDYTDLTSPIKAARCPHCSKIIPETNFSIDHKCSMCGQILKELKWKEDTNLDTDEDGIPDKIEQQVGMDDQNPNDIYDDKDGDGFSNIYEYLTSKTKINDSKSRPPLVHRLVVTRIKRIKIPVKIKSVKTNGSDDKTAWMIQGEDLKKRRTKFWTLGEDIKIGKEKYKITGVDYRTKSEFDRSLKTHKDVDVSVVTFKRLVKKKEVGEPIVAVVGEKVYEPKEKIDFKDVISGSDKDLHGLYEGDVVKVGDQDTMVEKYLILSVDPVKKTVVVKENRKDGKTYTISKSSILEEQIKKRNNMKNKEFIPKGAGKRGNFKQPVPMDDDLFNFKRSK